jgi:uncharacterized phage-like protein YoqJ
MNVVEFPSINFEKALTFTGHRPQKLFGFDFQSEGNLKMLMKLRALIIRYIEKRGVHTFISGMALGIDMWSARIILSLKEKYPHLRLVCAIPCAEQFAKWSESDTIAYHEILEQADEVYYVSTELYTAWCMTDRNKWMVDNAHFVLAVWNGDENGGTWQTVKYAKKRQRPILQLHPKTLDINFH